VGGNWGQRCIVSFAIPGGFYLESLVNSQRLTFVFFELFNVLSRAEDAPGHGATFQNVLKKK